MKTKTKDWFKYGFATVWIVGSFILFFFLKDSANKDDVMEILKMGDVLILGYFFGSSIGSSDKNTIIANSTPVKANPEISNPEK